MVEVLDEKGKRRTTLHLGGFIIVCLNEVVVREVIEAEDLFVDYWTHWDEEVGEVIEAALESVLDSREDHLVERP